MLSIQERHAADGCGPAAPTLEPAVGSWYAVWTHSHCEQIVHDQLLHQGLHVLFPAINIWTVRRGQRRLSRVPLFPSYVFIRHAMDKHTHLQVLRSRGVVRVLGESWDRLTAIPDDEMDRIERVTRSGETVRPHPYLQEGQRARMIAGPFAGVEGIVLRTKANESILVLSVHLLHRSVAVSVDRTQVEPA